MVIDNIKRLLFLIFLVLLLLGVCIHIDYAANDTILATKNLTQQNITNCTLVNGTYYDNKIHTESMIKVSSYDKICHEPQVIGMYAKPSCGCRHRYTWHYREFINYCPNCGHYNCLGNKHKWGSRHEQEITCFHCDSDFCGVCGKEKYSWSRVYLKKG